MGLSAIRTASVSRRTRRLPIRGAHRIVAMACPKERACHQRGKHPPAKIGRTNKRRQDLSQMHKKPVKNDTFASHPGSHLHYFAEAVSSNAQTLRFRNIAQSTQTSGPLSLVFSGQRSWSRPSGVVGLALVREGPSCGTVASTVGSGYFVGLTTGLIFSPHFAAKTRRGCLRTRLLSSHHENRTLQSRFVA